MFFRLNYAKLCHFMRNLLKSDDYLLYSWLSAVKFLDMRIHDRRLIV